MIEIHKKALQEFAAFLVELDAAAYCKPLAQLNGSSIGAHTRHILELYQILVNAYSSGKINYDLRKRDKRIETEKNYALQVIDELMHDINKPDKMLLLYSDALSMFEGVSTSYHRELLYNLEHTIHHQALIRVGLKELSREYLVDSAFGVAPSTLQYNKNVYSHLSAIGS